MSKDYWKDNNGYPHSTAIHRQIAYKKIYLKDKDRYTLPFSKYVVHHIDTNKENFDVRNLYICTEEEHNAIHQKQKDNLKKFKGRKEIDNFLKTYIPKGQKKLEYNTPTEKIYSCFDCGKKTYYYGRCNECQRKMLSEEDYDRMGKDDKEISVLIVKILFILFIIYAVIKFLN